MRTEIFRLEELTPLTRGYAEEFFNSMENGYFFYQGKLCNLNRVARWGSNLAGPAPIWAKGTHGYFTINGDIVAITILDAYGKSLSLSFTTP
jgi:hypothetical protein